MIQEGEEGEVIRLEGAVIPILDEKVLEEDTSLKAVSYPVEQGSLPQIH